MPSPRIHMGGDTAMPYRRPVDDMIPEERVAYLEEGQRWFNQWGGRGYPFDAGSVERAYELLGMEQAVQLGAQMKAVGRNDIWEPRCDLAVEEARIIADEWEAEHDGQPYISFADVMECIVYETMENEGMVHEPDGGYHYDLSWKVPNISIGFLCLGSRLYEEGDAEGALSWNLRAINANPVAAPILLEVAECHKLLDNIDEGYEYACKALDVAWRMVDVAKARRSLAFFEGERRNYSAAAANLLLSHDYIPSAQAVQEFQWLLSKGWDGQMTLDEALEIAPEPNDDGIAVSETVMSSYSVALIFADQVGDAALQQSVLEQMLLANRNARKSLRPMTSQ